jgi:hypothetical protein
VGDVTSARSGVRGRAEVAEFVVQARGVKRYEVEVLWIIVSQQLFSGEDGFEIGICLSRGDIREDSGILKRRNRFESDDLITGFGCIVEKANIGDPSTVKVMDGVSGRR